MKIKKGYIIIVNDNIDIGLTKVEFSLFLVSTCHFSSHLILFAVHARPPIPDVVVTQSGVPGKGSLKFNHGISMSRFDVMIKGKWIKNTN